MISVIGGIWKKFLVIKNHYTHFIIKYIKIYYISNELKKVDTKGVDIPSLLLLKFLITSDLLTYLPFCEVFDILYYVYIS